MTGKIAPAEPNPLRCRMPHCDRQAAPGFDQCEDCHQVSSELEPELCDRHLPGHPEGCLNYALPGSAFCSRHGGEVAHTKVTTPTESAGSRPIHVFQGDPTHSSYKILKDLRQLAIDLGRPFDCLVEFRASGEVYFRDVSLSGETPRG